MRKSSLALTAAGLLASLSVAAYAGPEPLPAADQPAPKHRRAGIGVKAHQRAARKARNVRRNRSAHRG